MKTFLVSGFLLLLTIAMPTQAIPMQAPGFEGFTSPGPQAKAIGSKDWLKFLPKQNKKGKLQALKAKKWLKPPPQLGWLPQPLLPVLPPELPVATPGPIGTPPVKVWEPPVFSLMMLGLMGIVGMRRKLHAGV